MSDHIIGGTNCALMTSIEVLSVQYAGCELTEHKGPGFESSHWVLLSTQLGVLVQFASLIYSQPDQVLQDHFIGLTNCGNWPRPFIF